MTEDIKDLLNGQVLWLQSAANRILPNGTLSGGDIQEFVQLIKSPPATRPTFT